MKTIKPLAIELFAGAGGLSIGLEKAGFEIIVANEIERDFAKTFALNHPTTKLIQDDIHNINFVRELELLNLSNIDLLSGGPPCQGFSTVGSKKKKDPRNSLFYEYLRAVKEIQPNYIIFENVSGFIKMYNGTAYSQLLKELDALGYYTTSSILEASDFGLPQFRQRTIILGWRKKIPKVKLPTPTHCSTSNVFQQPLKLTIMDAISDLPPLKNNDKNSRYKCLPQNNYQKILRGEEEVLTEHNSTKYGEKMIKILSLIPDGGSVKDLPFSLRPKKYFLNTYARLYPNKLAPTITRNFGTPSSSRCIHPFQNRALSTREGASYKVFLIVINFMEVKLLKIYKLGMLYHQY